MITININDKQCDWLTHALSLYKNILESDRDIVIHDCDNDRLNKYAAIINDIDTIMLSIKNGGDNINVISDNKRLSEECEQGYLLLEKLYNVVYTDCRLIEAKIKNYEKFLGKNKKGDVYHMIIGLQESLKIFSSIDKVASDFVGRNTNGKAR